MPKVFSTFWVRGIKSCNFPSNIDDSWSHEFTVIVGEENEYQEAKYPGTIAFKVMTTFFDPENKEVWSGQIGWVPAELCGWVMQHKPDNPQIRQINTYYNGEVLGIEVGFWSDELMPKQKSVGG